VSASQNGPGGAARESECFGLLIESVISLSNQSFTDLPDLGGLARFLVRNADHLPHWQARWRIDDIPELAIGHRVPKRELGGLGSSNELNARQRK